MSVFRRIGIRAELANDRVAPLWVVENSDVIGPVGAGLVSAAIDLAHKASS